MSSKTFETVGNYVAYTMSDYEHCYINLQYSFAEYQSRFSSKTRSTISRKVKKFAAQCNGSMRFERSVKPSELRSFHQLARQVSVLTYQEKWLDLGLPDDEAFIRGMMANAEADCVRAFLLLDADKPVAYLYCPIVDGTVEYAYLGFDPSYAERSPGTVLLWLSLESLFGERTFSLFDFTEGSSPQKQLFSTDRVFCRNRLYLRRGFLREGLLRTHYVFDQGSVELGRLLDRFGLKQKVKHLLRGR
jgi:CelD/BcsL family acetyltransferase involved in cellulose biosynthesis